MKGKGKHGPTNQSNASVLAPSIAMVQKTPEVLIVGSSSSDPFSTIVVDPRTGVSTWSHKGSEFQGASTTHVKPLGTSGTHLIASIKDRPLLHTFAVNSKDKFHMKSVVSGPVSSFCTSKDGTLLFAAIRNQIFSWLLTTGELLSSCDAHYQSVTHIALSEDDSMLFTCSLDGAVHVYLISELLSYDRRQNIAPIRQWRAHSLAVRGLAVTRGRDPRIVSCGLDHIAAIHSISNDECLLKISADRPLTACVVDQAESRLFLGTDIGGIAQVNLFHMEPVTELLIQTTDERNNKVPIFNGHSEEISSLAVNGDGTLLASGDLSGKYCIWDIISRQTLKVSAMRGQVSSLMFVANWASWSSSEFISAWNPSFDLQRNLSSGKSMRLHSSQKKSNEEPWSNIADELIDKLLFEMNTVDPVERHNKKAKSEKREAMQAKNVHLEMDIRELSIKIAVEVGNYLYKHNLATLHPEPEDKEMFIRQKLYSVEYDDLINKTYDWPAKDSKHGFPVPVLRRTSMDEE